METDHGLETLYYVYLIYKTVSNFLSTFGTFCIKIVSIDGINAVLHGRL